MNVTCIEFVQMIRMATGTQKGITTGRKSKGKRDTETNLPSKKLYR